MTEIESKHGTVSRQPYELYMSFTDMRNFLQTLYYYGAKFRNLTPRCKDDRNLQKNVFFSVFVRKNALFSRHWDNISVTGVLSCNY